jgi:hypothetical protein
VKVKLKLFPGGRSPELKAPWSAVTVWVTVSLLVQVTFVPTLTVRVVGPKAKFMIETLSPVLEGVFVGAVVGVFVGTEVGVFVGTDVGVIVGADVVVLPQAARSTRRPIASRHSHAVVVCI